MTDGIKQFTFQQRKLHLPLLRLLPGSKGANQ
jgi:hypothetical protein